MKRSTWLYAALLALALAAGLSAPSNAPESTIPSAKNPGPRGVKLLRAWLEHTGRDVRLLETPKFPADLRTLVLVAPTGHGVSAEQRAEIEAFVRRGGTLVYLRPRHSDAQGELDRWLELDRGPPPGADLSAADMLGVSEKVALLDPVKTVRTLADDSVEVGLPAAIPLTKSHNLWWAPLGNGEIFIGSGADLAEGQRLELDDNAAFWARLKGPIGFDELHQAPKPSPDLSANLVAAFAQLAFCGLAFLLVFGRRLGPARPTPVEQHRSSLEYVASMAALTEKARVERQLADELYSRLQRVVELPAHELPLKPDSVDSPEEFLRFSQRCADLEARARGLSPRS